jgi:site-specific DNA recombinase
MNRKATSLEVPERKRAAIYTRKSTSAGLEQDFNSLDAQREACEGYIRSQAHHGWTLIDRRYDDGGFSGANIERPAFQQLLADVDAGNVDVIVVYKVDRLSRSLLDFAKLMDRFNQVGVTFVSVTQNFSTADAIGRLTLNMLMSFAEFEREMIAERTRDKIAAARRKGKWTGGQVPLGYDVVDKKLVPNELEAVLVSDIFDLYIERRSALAVANELNEQKRYTKRRRTNDGKAKKSHPWNKTDVLRVLKNPVYAGMISYKDEVHEAEHDSIIERERWQQAQEILNGKTKSRRGHPRNHGYLLRGLLYCELCNARYTTASTRKNGKEYRYYRCSTKDKRGNTGCTARQIPAGAIEAFVIDRIREATADGTLAQDIQTKLNERIEERQKNLATERVKLPLAIAELSAEGTDLLRRLSEMEGPGKRFVEVRLEEVGIQQANLNERLVIVERDLAALENTKVEAKWIVKTLDAFSEVWDALNLENRSRFVHAIVDRVVVNEPEGKVEAFLAKFEDAPDTTDDENTEDDSRSARPNLTLVKDEDTP